ncbi:hypothetical protein D3C85_1636760 [compost metagenome]
MNIANWPADSLSLYFSAVAPVMTNKGFSLANGSLKNPLLSTVPAVVGRPPVQAGILPSAFAALTPPIGVSVLPSCAASSGETLAITAVARSESARAPDCTSILVVFM